MKSNLIKIIKENVSFKLSLEFISIFTQLYIIHSYDSILCAQFESIYLCSHSILIAFSLTIYAYFQEMIIFQR